MTDESPSVDDLLVWPPHPVPRILVAEDDGEMRRLVIEALQKDGYQVAGIADGGQLLNRINDQKRREPEVIDLIVTDMRMPVVNGLEIVQRLRDAHSTIPIVVITAFGDEKTRTRAEQLDAVLLDKPFRVEVLRTIVGSLLCLAKR